MSDEIKEILDNTLEYLEGIDETRNTKILTTNETNVLLDYITNLQQENEKLKQEYINVRNYIKMRNVNTEVEDKALLYNMELENINKKKYLDYKSRCEKAIEYNNQIIKDTKDFYRSTTDIIYSGDALIEIATNNINILQGENNGN